MNPFSMNLPAIPADEAERLTVLRSLKILDTLPEERFDRLTRVAQRVFSVPIASISLIDENRMWFKSCQGLGDQSTRPTQMPRDISFCGHAILGDDIFVIPDTLADERFCDNPLVLGEPMVRFYAGRPLWVNGSRVGTLCLIDTNPRSFSKDEGNLLNDLACMAEQEMTTLEMATIDEMTGILNQRGFMAFGQKSLGLCARLKSPASLFYFDLDGFKLINDTHGHAQGDLALKAFASALRATYRDSDVIGRIGGDEFVALTTNCSEADGEHALERLKQAVAAHNRECDPSLWLRFSAGLVAFDAKKHGSISDLMAQADAKMYERKKLKKSRS